MTHFPLHLDLTGRQVLVVGAGRVAGRRTRALLAAGAVVQVVAPSVAADFPDVPVRRRPFVPTDLDGSWLVFACTGAIDDVVAAACELRGTWCVRADDSAASAAWMPAIGRVDDLVVSVTSGGDPGRSTTVRDQLMLALETGDVPLRRTRRRTGSVVLIGGGPGDPGLLTVRGRRVLAEADVIVRDRLAPRYEAPEGVEVVDVGKSPGGPSYDQRKIEQLLVDRAAAGQRVVRLKGGDVHLFGRGMEEVAACVAAGIAVDVIPGVSSAFAVPTWAGIPVTARGVTQSVSVVSAHVPPGDPSSTVDWDALARLGGTLVLLMAVGRLPSVCAALVAGGRDPATPVAVVQDGTLPTQLVVITTLRDVAQDAAAVQAPAVVVVGEVVALR